MEFNEDELKEISNTKMFFNMFKTLEEKYFYELVNSLDKKNEEMNDWLFDYLYNASDELEFDEYLKHHNINLDE